MKSVYPSFYPAFRCKASACRHTCCRGWEIDIDPASESIYHKVSGALGEKLRASIKQEDGVASFILNEDDRCPFLQQDGLCELILQLGEASLCEICREHPRFYEQIGDTELIGLGLSCEAVAALLLHEHALSFQICYEDGVVSAADLNGVCHLLQIPLPPTLAEFRPAQAKRLLDRHYGLFYETEVMDPSWTAMLHASEKPCDDKPSAAERSYQPIFDYILYRQLALSDSYDMETLSCYAEISTALIIKMIENGADPVRALVSWSEEIEYSTQNVTYLLDRLSD